MKVNEVICDCEVVYISEDGEVLSEATVRAFKRYGNKIKKKYRCLSGRKKGKLVGTPSDCSKRKDPKKVRLGRKVMRSKKGVIKTKTRIAKRKAISKLLSRRNKTLRGRR